MKYMASVIVKSYKKTGGSIMKYQTSIRPYTRRLSSHTLC